MINLSDKAIAVMKQVGKFDKSSKAIAERAEKQNKVYKHQVQVISDDLER
jgi:hypothetical protein